MPNTLPILSGFKPQMIDWRRNADSSYNWFMLIYLTFGIQLLLKKRPFWFCDEFIKCFAMCRVSRSDL